MSVSDGWVPQEPALWPLVVAMLEGGTEPWPREFCVYDLRWTFDQKGCVPSRRAVMARWRVTEKVARRLLADVAEWWDPKKGEPPQGRGSQQGPSEGPARAQQGPKRNGRTETIDEKGPSEVPRRAHEGPNKVHRRGDPQPHSQPQPQTDVSPAPPALALVRPADEDEQPTEPDTPAEPDAFTLAAEYAGQVLNPAVGRGLSHGPGRRSSLGQKLLREVKRDAARVMSAMRFVVESPHDRAEFLRSKGLGLETVLRHLNEYAELASARGPPERGYHPPVETPPMSDAEFAAAAASLQQAFEKPLWT